MDNHELKDKLIISFCIILGIGMVLLLTITTITAMVYGNGQVVLHFNDYGEGTFEMILMPILSAIMIAFGIKNMKYVFRKKEDD